MKRFYLLPILILIVFSSCKKDNSIAPQDKTQAEETQQGMIPLKKGFKWTISFAYYDSLGRVVNSGQATEEIVRDTLIENEKWYIYTDGSIYTNRNGELYYYTTSTKKVNLTFGTSIDDTSKPSKYFDGRYLIAKDVKIKCSLGEFSCYLYQIYWTSPGGRIGERYYVAPGKGIIRYESYADLKGKYFLNSAEELTSTNAF